jgi:hypothetical protein
LGWNKNLEDVVISCHWILTIVFFLRHDHVKSALRVFQKGVINEAEKTTHNLTVVCLFVFWQVQLLLEHAAWRSCTDFAISSHACIYIYVHMISITIFAWQLVWRQRADVFCYLRSIWSGWDVYY